MRPRRGFTLVELLITVTITATLMGILLSALRGARVHAKRAACASQLRQIGVGFRMYLPTNNDRLPFASFMPSVGPMPLRTEKPIAIADVLLNEVGGDPAVFRCPNDDSDVLRPDPNNGKSYFESERSSYEYRGQFGGRRLSEVADRINKRSDRIVSDNMLYIMRDYNNFHGPAGTNGARRYLYIDGHVSDYEN